MPSFTTVMKVSTPNHENIKFYFIYDHILEGVNPSLVISLSLLSKLQIPNFAQLENVVCLENITPEIMQCEFYRNVGSSADSNPQKSLQYFHFHVRFKQEAICL